MRRFVVEGPKLVAEALEAGLDVDHVIVPSGSTPDPSLVERIGPVPLYQLDADAFDRLASTEAPQPAMAVVASPPLDADERFRPAVGFVLVLVDVSDPGNVGTLLRTAEASGATGVLLCGATADVLSPKVVRSSAGSVLRVPMAELPEPVDELGPALHDLGFQIVATGMDGDPFDDVDLRGEPTAYLLGSEAKGLPPAVIAAADRLVTIPMRGQVESLNVATSGAVLAFDRARRDRAARDREG